MDVKRTNEGIQISLADFIIVGNDNKQTSKQTNSRKDIKHSASNTMEMLEYMALTYVDGFACVGDDNFIESGILKSSK